jgi:hypothetical protein
MHMRLFVLVFVGLVMLTAAALGTEVRLANGRVVINPDGTLTYTPDFDFVGIETFQYAVSDGNGGTDTATVTVEVICPEKGKRPAACKGDKGGKPKR